jgi:uncharacterized protein DUF998
VIPTLRLIGVAAPPLAVAIVFVAGAMTPGYDPMSRTVSRLAVPGMPAALAVDLAIALIALTCFALAFGLAREATVARIALVVSGVALVAAAVVHLDPASGLATGAHRVASAVAVLGLTLAPLAYGRLSLAAGIAELGMLVAGLALLATSFDAWGAWERLLLAIPLAWMVLIAVKTDSREESIKSRRASLSQSGS